VEEGGIDVEIGFGSAILLQKWIICFLSWNCCGTVVLFGIAIASQVDGGERKMNSLKLP